MIQVGDTVQPLNKPAIMHGKLSFYIQQYTEISFNNVTSDNNRLTLAVAVLVQRVQSYNFHGACLLKCAVSWIISILGQMSL